MDEKTCQLHSSAVNLNLECQTFFLFLKMGDDNVRGSIIISNIVFNFY